MNSIDTLVTVCGVCAVLLLVQALRWPVGGDIVMGGGVERSQVGQRQRVALEQYRWSFVLVFVAGACALALWVVALGLQLAGWGASASAKVGAGVLLVGSSALFGYFLRVWRECRREVRRG